MGGGVYSSVSRDTRHIASGTYLKSPEQNFTSRSINNAMNPHGIKIRESRDSDEHPNSVAIIVALDVTGSMGSVPNHLVKHGLPKMMDDIIGKGIADPQILFLGIGDHECDTSPLQVGQFESSDELVDKWLLDTFLEGGGGGNAGESYMLAWYFAAYHTALDCLEKRGQKGFLFTIGDEPVLKDIPGAAIKALMGDGQYDTDYLSSKLLEKAMEKYNVHHLHIRETYSGSREEVMDGWKQMMGDNCHVIQSSDHVSSAIAGIISTSDKLVDDEVSTDTPTESVNDESGGEEIL